MGPINRTLMLIVGAVAYSFAFPPYGWWPLAPLSVGILIGVLYKADRRAGFWLGFAWGLVALGTGLSWFWNIFGVLSLLLWALLALFPALFGWLVGLARHRRLSGWRLAFFAALAWCGTEFVRCELMPLRLPWLHLGLALEPWPLVSWVGVYGLGFVAAWVIAALVTRRWWTCLWILAGSALVWSMESRMFKAPKVAVAAIQAETAPLSTYLDLSRQAPASTRLIVWPEYAVPKDVRNPPSAELDAIQKLASEFHAHVVFGTQTRLQGAKWQNTALTVNAEGVVGEHGKNHTVHLFDDGERGPTASAFVVGLDWPRPAAPIVGLMGTPICFDCDFHDVVRRMTLEGAELFAVPSMDAVSWSARQHIQHAQLFRVRAAENRRCMVVAASSGVSQIIDPTGRATASLGAMKQGVLNGTVSFHTQLTPFTRVGWLMPWVVLGALSMWTAWLLAFSPQEKRRSQP